MPTYDYACDSCGHRFEKKQRFSDEPVRICSECGSEVRRVFHPAGIIFKGSGFYVTDNRASNGANSSSTSESASKTSVESSDSTSNGTSSSSESSTKTKTAKET